MLTVVKILLAWTGTLKIIYLEKVKVIIYLERKVFYLFLFCCVYGNSDGRSGRKQTQLELTQVTG